MKLNIEFPVDYSGHDKVAVIKALRGLTGMGLKEAKDMSETASALIDIKVSPALNSYLQDDESYINEQCRILRFNGCRVGESVHTILQSLRELGCEALKQGEDELANEILQLVLAEKLRRKNHET